MRTVGLLALLALPITAGAQTTPERAADYAGYWKSRLVAGVGGGLGVLALPAGVYGASRLDWKGDTGALDFRDPGTIALIGAGALAAIGPPMLAGGTLRGRTVLKANGVEVSPVPGYLSWGLWAGAVAMLAAQPLSSDQLVGVWTIPGAALYTGSLALGAVQYWLNETSVRRAPAYGARRSSWAIAPVIGPRPGLALAAAW